ncbi:right-handed parallel beta-helix repeat-containing protein [Fulvivirgaceae bacterium BMA12]|uniref:Right-handed parallel beta-helix repeat-containing protein n=1 Tax=Agaribacillus aureus TaxID=3051825 RepID=A0ABT8LCZ8_9BACT|nr:right-handed parallel beta-helix repeat-containing protein [Fulvivirgaceae bacterium BMA12]
MTTTSRGTYLLKYFLIFLVLIITSCKDDDIAPAPGTGGPPDSPPPEPNDVGVNYYIASSGDDSNDGLSPETAWKTSGRVSSHEKFEPGDQILFLRGETFDNITLTEAGNGTVKDRIVIGAYGDENLAKPILQGSRDPFSFTIRINSMSGITIQDLKIQGANGDQIYIDPVNGRCDNIKILNCHIDGENGRHCIRFETDIDSGSFFGADSVEVAFNLIENAGQGYDNTSDGLNFSNVQKNGYVHHNTFFNNKSEAIDIAAGTGHVVEFNIMDGNGDRDSGGIKTHSLTGNGIHDTENMIIRKNIIKNCIQHAVQIQDGRFIKVFNNTIYHNEENGKNALLIGSSNEALYDADTWITGNEIKNNIFHGVTHTITITVIRFGGSKSGSPAIFWNDHDRYDISNNIFFGGDEANAVVVRIQTNQFMSDEPYTDFSNLGSNNSLPYADFLQYHPDNFNVNPLLNDPENGDFSLKSNSPAIDAGLAVGLTADFDGKAINGKPDLGAFEF